MIGMLIGIAALSAWGLYRRNQYLQTMGTPPQCAGMNPLSAVACRYRAAYVMQFGDILMVTALVCVVGAVLGLLIAGRTEHADDPDSEVEAIGASR